MSELKPCPFCGGEAEIVGGSENWTPSVYDPDSGGDPIAVKCTSCQCGLHFFDDYSEAIAAWNRRADGWIPVTERLPEVLEAVLIVYHGEVGADMLLDDKLWAGGMNVTHWMPLPEPPKGE